MNPKRALVREPGSNFPKCITSHPLKHTISHSNALKQHSEYCQALESLNLEIIYLARNDKHPDSCFVEDNAVIHNRKALITRMGAVSRRGEEIAVEELLQGYMETKRVVTPAIIEGGDVIHLTDRLICGITQRTNIDGVHQMENWLGVTVDTCVDPNIIHLKSYITYLGNDFAIATKSYTDNPVLNNFNILIVQEDESYAANTLTVNNCVLMPKGFPKTQDMVREAGFEVIPLDMSEFQKCEGSLTCLSLIF
ncbi:MAG: dimethylarginine dimethylaminohydrolase family protein [Candidatus Hodarchaeales archaeon]|jgi:dimethylargininase